MHALKRTAHRPCVRDPGHGPAQDRQGQHAPWVDHIAAHAPGEVQGQGSAATADAIARSSTAAANAGAAAVLDRSSATAFYRCRRRHCGRRRCCSAAAAAWHAGVQEPCRHWEYVTNLQCQGERLAWRQGDSALGPLALRGGHPAKEERGRGARVRGALGRWCAVHWHAVTQRGTCRLGASCLLVQCTAPGGTTVTAQCQPGDTTVIAQSFGAPLTCRCPPPPLPHACHPAQSSAPSLTRARATCAGAEQMCVSGGAVLCMQNQHIKCTEQRMAAFA